MTRPDPADRSDEPPDAPLRARSAGERAPAVSTRHRGDEAERAARDFLVERGLLPLGANWRRRLGEIDLIMREPASGTTVFVEVRYRGRADLGGGLASIDRNKRARMRRAALAWLQRHGDPDAPARIDVIAVGPGEPEAIGGGTGGAAASAEPEGGLVAHRDGRRLEWVVSAVEED